MKIQEDCYFYIDENKVISVLCVNCHEKNPLGWYWPGKLKGYGHFNVNCTVCNAFVNKIEEDEGLNEI